MKYLCKRREDNYIGEEYYNYILYILFMYFLSTLWLYVSGVVA